MGPARQAFGRLRRDRGKMGPLRRHMTFHMVGHAAKALTEKPYERAEKSISRIHFRIYKLPGNDGADRFLKCGRRGHA